MTSALYNNNNLCGKFGRLTFPPLESWKWNYTYELGFHSGDKECFGWLCSPFIRSARALHQRRLEPPTPLSFTSSLPYPLRHNCSAVSSVSRQLALTLFWVVNFVRRQRSRKVNWKWSTKLFSEAFYQIRNPEMESMLEVASRDLHLVSKWAQCASE